MGAAFPSCATVYAHNQAVLTTNNVAKQRDVSVSSKKTNKTKTNCLCVFLRIVPLCDLPLALSPFPLHTLAPPPCFCTLTWLLSDFQEVVVL